MKKVDVIKKIVFLSIVYPGIFLAINFIVIKVLEIDKMKNAGFSEYYGFIILLISIVGISMFILDLVTKIYKYSLQGEKLKIRLKEGVDVRELNNKN